jgi:DNA polymerase III delta prime subunit
MTIYNMKQLLLNEKWRPKTIEDMVILPRVRKIFEKGLTQNVILYGHFGTGKTTLARILIGKWSKDKPFLEINSSFYTSIDTLRSKVDDFCSQVYMGLDLLGDDTQKTDMKYVFLDEFERTSPQYQDALKAYIEEYSNKNVRFILNTNHIDKISDGIKSRMLLVNFDAQNQEEERFLKRSIYTKIMGQVCQEEGITTMTRDILVKLINSCYPDFRSLYNKIQYFAQTGELETGGLVEEETKLQLFEMIHDQQLDNEKTYHFVFEKFGPDRITDMLKTLGSPYINWCLKNKRDKLNSLFEANTLVSAGSLQLTSSDDPIVVGLSVIGNMNKLMS